MAQFLAFELSDGVVVNIEDEVGAKVKDTKCPSCDEGDLVLQSKGHGGTYSRYLECSNEEECGRMFYR